MNILFPVTSKPHMDDEGYLFFSEKISEVKCYLEYGCGGSTVYAANVAKVESIVSVDTSRQWIDSVIAATEGSGSQILIEYCDLGETGDWGVPKSEEKIKQFWRYVFIPWNTARQHSLSPELILIDGRFRIASFLFSLLSAPDGATILFDDYFDRPHYFVVEEFCRVEQKKGRLAAFRVGKSFSQMDLVAKLLAHSLDWS